MPKGYTSNQTGAIACLLGSLIWGLTAYAFVLLQNISHPIYVPFIIIGFILIPFYIKSFRIALIVGIFNLTIPMCYLAFLPELLGTAPWYTFSRGLYDFTYVVWFLISIACIYFSYQTFKELGKIRQVKLVYTSNQTGAIACLLGICMWALLSHSIARMLGKASIIYSVFTIISWILVLFYIRLISHTFIIGILLTILAMTYLTVTPILLGTAPWYLSKRGLFDFTYVVYYIIGLAHIYFAYKSYTELLRRT